MNEVSGNIRSVVWGCQTSLRDSDPLPGGWSVTSSREIRPGVSVSRNWRCLPAHEPRRLYPSSLWLYGGLAWPSLAV